MIILKKGLILLLLLIFRGGFGQQKIAITEVNIVPMDRPHVVANCTILISDGIIQKIQQNKTMIPKVYKIINAKGKYLIPGLCDMHIHLRTTDELTAFLRHGVTTVLHMSGATKTAPDLFEYRDKIRNNKMIAPNLYFTTQCVEGKQMNFPSVSVSLTSQEQVDAFVNEAISRQYDFVKMYETIDSTLYFYLIEQTKRKGIAVVGHTPRNVNPTKMLQAGQVMVAHGEEFFFDYFECRDCGITQKPNEHKIPELIRLLLENKMYVTPNLSFIKATELAIQNFESFENDEEFKYLAESVVNVWKNSNPAKRMGFDKFKERETVKYAFVKKLTNALNKAGVPLLAGTDCSLAGLFAGKSLHLDLFEMKNAGLSNFECLKTATVNAGVFIQQYALTGKNEKFGQIKEGYRADLLLLEGNPLDKLSNIANINAIIVRGNYWKKSDLDKMQKVYNLKLK